MLWTDLRHLKSQLEIDPDDKEEDKNLQFFIEQATAWFEDYLNRDFSLRSTTEFYGGSNTQKLLLRRRPVYTTPTIQCWVDESGYYGQATDAFTGTALTYGDDFVLQVKEQGKPSRSGILIRINSFWLKPTVRTPGLLSPYFGQSFGNIKVTYTAGYTVDTLPEQLRLAANLLVAKMRFVFPTGLELTSDGYEDRTLSWAAERKDYFMGLVAPILWNYRNWKWF